MAARRRFYEKLRNQGPLTDEEVMEKLREKRRRLAEKLGWEDDWHKKKVKEDLRKKKSHKSRVKHMGHGK